MTSLFIWFLYFLLVFLCTFFFFFVAFINALMKEQNIKIQSFLRKGKIKNHYWLYNCTIFRNCRHYFRQIIAPIIHLVDFLYCFSLQQYLLYFMWQGWEDDLGAEGVDADNVVKNKGRKRYKKRLRKVLKKRKHSQ